MSKIWKLLSSNTSSSNTLQKQLFWEILHSLQAISCEKSHLMVDLLDKSEDLGIFPYNNACSKRNISKNNKFYFKLIETMLELDKYTILGKFEAYLIILCTFLSRK